MATATTLFDYPAQPSMDRAAQVMDTVSGRRPQDEVEPVPGLDAAVAAVSLALENGHPHNKSGGFRFADQWLVPQGREGLHMTRAIAREIDAYEAGMQEDMRPKAIMSRIAHDVVMATTNGRETPGAALDAELGISARAAEAQRSQISRGNARMVEMMSDFKEDGVPLFRDGDGDATQRHIRAEARVSDLEKGVGSPPSGHVEIGIAAHVRATRLSNRNDKSAHDARVAIMAENANGQEGVATTAAGIAIRTEALTVSMKEAKARLTGGRRSIEETRRNDAVAYGRLSSLDRDAQILLHQRLHHATDVSPLTAMTIRMEAHRMEAAQQIRERDLDHGQGQLFGASAAHALRMRETSRSAGA